VIHAHGHSGSNQKSATDFSDMRDPLLDGLLADKHNPSRGSPIPAAGP
jgi:hypothetical protein